MASVVFNSISGISLAGVTIDYTVTLEGNEGSPILTHITILKETYPTEVVPTVSKWMAMNPEPTFMLYTRTAQYNSPLPGSIHFNYRHQGNLEPGETYRIYVLVYNTSGMDPNQSFENAHISEPFEVPDFALPFLTDLSSYRWSKNPIYKEVTGVTGVNNSNYTVSAELYIESIYKGNIFEKVADQELTLDLENKAMFFFEELISDFLKPELPAAGLNTIVRASQILKRAQILFFEKSGYPEEITQLGGVEHFVTVLGGIQKQMQPGLDYFNTFLPDNKKFLTWQPVSKKVMKDQPEFLFFLLYQLTSKIELWAEVHFEDDTKNKYKLLTYNNPQVGEIFIMPAGYDQLNIAGLAPAKIPVCYQLFIQNNDAEEISERRQYMLEEDYEPFTRYILFHTSLGGFDTLRATGKSSQTMNIDNEVLQKMLPHDYNVEDGEVHVSYSSYYDEYDFSTGFLPTKGYRDYLRDILISKARFLIEDGKRIPIVIDTKSIKIKEDDEYQPFLRFKFRKSYNDMVVTSILNDSLQDCPVLPREKAWRVKASSMYCLKA